ncbi:hypothetical protein D3C87_2053250 [compost metagenome]
MPKAKGEAVIPQPATMLTETVKVAVEVAEMAGAGNRLSVKTLRMPTRARMPLSRCI